MQNKIFIDSNIWLYLFLQDDNEKYKIIEEYLLRNNLNSTFIITYQVINEIVLIASSVREKYSISFWDSIIIGSALFAKCDVLISEDMQDGLTIDNKLLIKNIF